MVVFAQIRVKICLAVSPPLRPPEGSESAESATQGENHGRERCYQYWLNHNQAASTGDGALDDCTNVQDLKIRVSCQWKTVSAYQSLIADRAYEAAAFIPIQETAGQTI